ncbi:hypothetical protein [Variovorax soli]|uniref:hypothetical protein n=1 Tax=Variovorax soli TaxID=376815 RepID=UPI00083968EA|nr:hypothetical protein [Variovorax soli]
MDIALLSLILTTLFSVAALAVSIYALEEGRRAILLRWARNWGYRLLIAVFLANSAYGAFEFLATTGQATRGQIFTFAVHIFNALAIGFIVLMVDFGKALEQRAAKRKELEETVNQLKARLDSLGA